MQNEFDFFLPTVLLSMIVWTTTQTEQTKLSFQALSHPINSEDNEKWQGAFNDNGYLNQLYVDGGGKIDSTYAPKEGRETVWEVSREQCPLKHLKMRAGFLFRTEIKVQILKSFHRKFKRSLKIENCQFYPHGRGIKYKCDV